MIIYRVILKVSYHEAYFDFDSIEDAGQFARTVLVHHSVNDDTRNFDGVNILVVNTDKKEGDDEE